MGCEWWVVVTIILCQAKRSQAKRRVRRVYMGRVAEAERSARATEPTTPLDTLGGPVRRRAGSSDSVTAATSAVLGSALEAIEDGHAGMPSAALSTPRFAGL